ncbi:MAG: type II secretion system protein, partial [Phycisphaeraceae bacterium]
MKRLNPTPRRRVRGFSITELLVSISIVGLLLAIVFPVISVMTNSSRVEAGQNVVGMASDVARQWVQAEAWANDASTNAGSAVNEQYSGTAALYCPTGEIR